ncbi:glycosyltransferase family 4 protein [Roseiconus nitratireducens]|uniref:Glycosyltransferase family 4 protein n=1 Tax=Roseiconus nitratireducens TaxID=2605748 RepID=A0A5M6DIR8_9BACT|nr:glycosyltransferase family 4 protein [Roseiconus nitratireducens]KAA5546130.1 glycosyltransferase family 4 protein [Roseiconus nitratireducens]
MARIAFISGMGGFAWGGSEELWSQAATILAGRGHQLIAYVNRSQPRPVQVQALADAGIKILEGHPRQKLRRDRAKDFVRYRIGGSIFSAQATPVFNRRAKEALLKFSPDLVVVSNGAIGCGLDWMEFCRQESLPYVVIAQANSETLWPKDAIAERLRACYQSAQVSCFVSQRNRELFEMQVGQRLDNAVVVRNPLNLDKPNAPLPFPPQPPWVLSCVGRLDPTAKGQDILLQTLALPGWRERSVRVDVYGQGPMARTLTQAVTMLGLENRVRMCGQVQDVKEIWKQSHALVLPSRYEGLPLVVVEAMICGRIPIVTDVAGNTEVVTDGRTGFVAEAPTVPLFSAALERAWQQRDRWCDMGAAARDEILASFPECSATAFAELVEDAIHRDAVASNPAG